MIKLNEAIPCIIHQTYKSIEQLPEHWVDTPRTWKQYNVGWEYKFWSDADCVALVAKAFPQYLDFYNSLEYNIQRADLIRYMFLYEYGGFYADCDITCKKSLNLMSVEDHNVYLIRTPNTNSITNCIMASKSKQNFWLRVIEEVKKRVENPSIFWIGKHWTVMQTTGPMMVNTLYNEYKDICNIGLFEKELLLPSCCSTCSEKPCTSNESYTQLVEGSSWVEYDTKIYNFFLCNYRFVLVVLALIFIIYKFS